MAKTVRFTNKFVNFGEWRKRHAQGEANVEVYDICGPRYYDNIDLLALTWFVRATHPNYDTLINKPLACAELPDAPEQIRLTWPVDGDFTACVGELQVQFVGKSTGGREIIKLQTNGLNIGPSVEGTVAPPQNMFETAVAQVEQLADNAANAAAQSKLDADRAEDAQQTVAENVAQAAELVTQIEGDADAAATSAAAAKTSETNAAASRVAAADRATAAAASETAAAKSATAAAGSATAAKVSETNATASKEAASGSAVAAKTSEDHAAASKTAAASSASAAKASETAAAASKTAAKSSEDNALASKTAAAGSASAAAGSATAAKSSETAAAKSATAAAGSATTAKSSETAATASKDAAAGSAAAAKISEDNAAASKTAAAGSAAAAKNSETAAAASKTAAASSATAAKTSETAAAASATAAAKSAEEAKIAAGGGVLKFNGRTGEVVPQAGDYTAAQVGAVATSGGELAKTKVTYTTPKSGAPASGETMEVIMAKVTAMYNRMVEIEAALPPIGDWVLAEDRIVYDSGGVNGRTYPWVNFDDNLDPAVYPKLYAKIGTKWSSGAPSGYFNLALLKDRFPLVSSSNFSKTGGEEKHKLTTQELPPSWVDIYFEDLQSMSEEAHNYIKNIGWSKTCKKATFGEFNTGDYGAKGTPHNNMPPYARVIVHIRAG